VSACTSLLGLESYLEGVEVEGRVVKVEAVCMRTSNLYLYLI
jgi:hypothetical protein